MDLEIDRSKLESSLDLLEKTVKDEPGLISSTILFTQSDDGDLVLESTNRRANSKIVIPSDDRSISELSGSGGFTVESGRLTQWVENVFGDDIRLQCDEGKGGSVFAKSEKAEGYFQSIDPSSFPQFPEDYEDSEPVLETTCGKLKESLSFVKDMVDASDSWGVAQMNTDRMIGTDSQVMAVYESDEFDEDFKIGKDDLKKILKILKKSPDDSTLILRKSGNVYFMEATSPTDDDFLLSFGQPYTSLPEIDNLPTELVEDEIWEFGVETLKSAVQALSATADSEDDNLSVSLKGEGDEGEMNLRMRDASENHNSTFSTACKRISSEHDNPSFSVNYNHLIDSLDLYSTDRIKAACGGEYVKLYNETSDDSKEIAIISLRRSDLS